MKLHHDEQIAAPQAAAFDCFADLDRMLAAVVPAGVTLRRSGQGPSLQAGTSWHCDMTFHGMEREVTLRLEEMTPPAGYVLGGHASGLKGAIVARFQACAANLTQARFDISVRPYALPGHMLMPPLRLLRPRLQARLARTICAMARDMEARA